MKTRTAFILLGFWMIIVGGCVPFAPVKGDGHLVTHQIAIGDYKKIEARSGTMDIEYVRSEEAPFLEITTDQNIYEKYDFVIEDGNTLKIKPQHKYLNKNFRATTFTVRTNSRQLIEASLVGNVDFTTNSRLSGDGLKFGVAGSGTINLNDTVIGDRVKMSIAGSGKINAFYLACQDYNGEIGGSGHLNITGNANRSSFKIAGSGNIGSFDFISNDVKCEIAGSGDIEVYANNSLKISIAGSGKIKYKGDPEEPSIKIAGSGTVNKVE